MDWLHYIINSFFTRITIQHVVNSNIFHIINHSEKFFEIFLLLLEIVSDIFGKNVCVFKIKIGISREFFCRVDTLVGFMRKYK